MFYTPEPVVKHCKQHCHFPPCVLIPEMLCELMSLPCHAFMRFSISSLAKTLVPQLLQWLTGDSITIHQAVGALQHQPIILKGPTLAQNPSPTCITAKLYQVREHSGNIGWQVRTSSFEPQTPSNWVQSSTVACFTALWVPVLAVCLILM